MVSQSLAHHNPIGLFSSERLPRKPYCSDELDYGVKIRTLTHALRCRYIQPNDPCRRHWLVFDVDREGAAFAWEHTVAEPNITVVNPNNDHAHLLYCLDVPIYLLGKVSIKPIKFAAAVESLYHTALDACDGYAGLLCKNPLHKSWKVLSGPTWAYDLKSLVVEYFPPAKIKKAKRRRKLLTGLGRNCTLFEALRLWAYRNINRTAWVSYDVWHRAVMDEAGQIAAQFTAAPLPYSEIKATAKSVSKWVWQTLRGLQSEYVARTHTPEVQAARGRKSGEARRKGSITEAAPWEELGISRATWYRRQQNDSETRT